MGRRRIHLFGSLAVALAGLALASAAPAADLSGTYIVVDGPFAGTTIVAGPDGKVAKKGERNGFVRAPTADCPYLHFQGVEGGGEDKKVAIKETDCLRVTDSAYAQDVLENLAAAIKAEENGKLDQAADKLGFALLDLESSATGDAKTLGEMGKRIKKARELDRDAQDERKKGDKKKAEALLDRAEKLKHQAADIAPLEVKLRLPPTVSPIDAVFQAASSQTVYTVSVTPRPGSLVRYLWSLASLNDPSCVFFEPGVPLANQATWHHGDTQGCNHALEGSNGHQGAIGVLVYDGYYSCGASYFGSNTGTGPPPAACKGAYD